MMGASIDASEDKRFVNFGLGLAMSADFCPAPKTAIVLPICSGVAHGHSALALGKNASVPGCGSLQEWHMLLNAQRNVIIHVIEHGWSEPVLQSTLFRINGIMVVHIESELIGDSPTRVKQLLDLKLPCTRIMASTSIILVATPNGSKFYYRGPTTLFAPPFGRVFNFGEAVDICFADLERMEMSFALGVVVSCDDSRIVVEGSVKAISVELISDTITNTTEAWHELHSQLAVALSSSEIEAMKSAVHARLMETRTHMESFHQAELNTAIEGLKAKFTTVPEGAEVTEYTHEARQRVLAIKSKIHAIQEPIRIALGRNDSLCSLRFVSTAKVGVQQAERKAAVAQNVARATKMTTDELSRELADSSWGFAVARVNTSHARDLLMAISAGGMDKFLQQIAEPVDNPMVLQSFDTMALKDPFSLAANCPMLDTDSIEILMKHDTSTHLLTSSTGKQLTFVMQGNAHIVLPLYNEGTAKIDGSYVNYMAECNRPEVANFRVSLRNMLSTLAERIPIAPQSVDLTFGIQMVPLAAMLSIVRDVRDISTLAPDSSICQILRGLLYLWGSFAGSGKQPCTMAFQLTQPGAVIAIPRKRGCVFPFPLHSFSRHDSPF
eukprot:191745-Prymnesium_polylepis.1